MRMHADTLSDHTYR